MKEGKSAMNKGQWEDQIAKRMCVLGMHTIETKLKSPEAARLLDLIY